MKTCPNCGFHHAEIDSTCLRCGTQLDPTHRIDPLAPADRPAIELPRRRGRRALDGPARLVGALRRRLFRLREALRSNPPKHLSRRKPWLAGALALLPGLGQLYNHQPKKAALMLAFVAMVCLIAAVSWFHPLSNWILLAYVLAMILSFHDAFLTANRINGSELIWQHKAAYYCAWILYVCMFCLLAQYLAGVFLVRFRYIRGDEMAPAINRGEKIAIDVWSYLWRPPRLGEVVYYDPPPIRMEQPAAVDAYGGVFSVNPGDGIERVVAGPGQVFERRDGTFYLDGQPVGPRGRPLVTDQIGRNFRLEAPKNHYIVLFSHSRSAFDVLAPLAQSKLHVPTEPGRPLTVALPRLDTPGWIVSGWAEACLVKRENIMGRVLGVYQPPEARRWIR